MSRQATCKWHLKSVKVNTNDKCKHKKGYRSENYQPKNCTVTSWLFKYIVSTEKNGKDTRDSKDRRGTKSTYYMAVFWYCF